MITMIIIIVIIIIIIIIIYYYIYIYWPIIMGFKLDLIIYILGVS